MGDSRSVCPDREMVNESFGFTDLSENNNRHGSCIVCKTQNSGLCSKEEKLRDPINEPSRCNTQEGLLSAAQPGDSDLLGGRAP